MKPTNVCFFDICVSRNSLISQIEFVMLVVRGWAGEWPGKGPDKKGRGFDSPHPLGMGTRSGTRGRGQG